MKRWTDEERNKFGAEFMTHIGAGSSQREAWAEAVKVLPEDRQRPFFSKLATSLCASLPGGESSQPARRKPTPAPLRPTDTPAGAALSIEDALDLLVDAILINVELFIGPRVDALVAGRVAVAAARVAIAASPKKAKVDLTKPETLDDNTLRIEIIKARATGDQLRWNKLVATKRKRDEAANSVEFHSGDNGAA